MKPYMLLAALAVIMIALSCVADAQTAIPTANPPGITQGPWTREPVPQICTGR